MRRSALLLAALLTACGPDPEPPPAPPRPAARPAPAVPKPPTLEDKMRTVREAEKAAPQEFRTHHEAWWLLAAEAKGTRHDAEIRERMELLEGAANKAYREIYRPLQAEIRQLVADRRPREAHDRLLAWRVPRQVDIQELLTADRGRELETLNELVDLEDRRGRFHAAVVRGEVGADPAAELHRFVFSDRVAVRAEAERSVLELRRLRAVEQRRQRLARAPKEGRPAFGERPGAAVPTERRFEGKIPAPVRRSFEAARGLLPRLLGAAQLQEFLDVSREALGHVAKAVDQAEWLPVAYYYRAEWKYAGLGDTLGAVADLDEALRRHPPFVEARLARARLLVELDLSNLASRDLVLLARSLPEPLHGPLVEARDHFDAERTTEALSALERAFRSLPEDLAFMDRKIRTRPPEPEWSERATTLETANYVFKAERSSPERLKALGEVVEAALAWFPSILRIDRAPTRKPRVYLFAGEESYTSFAEDDPEGMLSVSAGKYLGDGRLILYEDGAKDQTRTTLIHEAWHEYFGRARVQLPTWLNEGLAVYAEAAEFKEGRVTGSGIERGMARTLETAFAEGWPGLSFAEIMGESHREFHGTLEWLQYCQSWSMIHFFRHGDDGRRAGAFQAYLSLILSGASRAKAFEQTFGNLDLPALQEHWRAYVRGLTR